MKNIILVFAVLFTGCPNHAEVVEPPKDQVLSDVTWLKTGIFMYACSQLFDFISVETNNDSIPRKYTQILPKEIKIVNHSDRDTVYYASVVSGLLSADATYYLRYYARIDFSDPAYTDRFGLAMNLSVYVRY